MEYTLEIIEENDRVIIVRLKREDGTFFCGTIVKCPECNT
jgi:hypothetical protein